MGFYEPDVEQRLRHDADDILGRYPQGHERSALLPLLHLVQSEDGYVSSNGIALCADILNISQAEVSAVATFYTQYKRHPNGKYTVGVCTNALCAVMGGDAIFETLQDHLGVGNDETTGDGKITLEAVECNAACDYAPVIMVNWEFFDNQTPSSARQLVDDIQADKPIKPTRGPNVVPTFKEMSHVLAGFPDGHAHEGVSAGPASLRGLEAAEERGWTTDLAQEKPFVFQAEDATGKSDTGAADAQAEAQDASGTGSVGHKHSSAEHSTHDVAEDTKDTPGHSSQKGADND